MLSFRQIPSRRLGSSSTSHLRLLQTQNCCPRVDRNVTYNLAHSCHPFSSEMASSNCSHSFCSLQLCKAQIVIILLIFGLFSSDVIISPYPLKMSPQNSASHLTLPRTQACFPRPFVVFCLSDGISLTASAYRGIRSNANSADRNVTHNLARSCYPFSSAFSSEM